MKNSKHSIAMAILAFAFTAASPLTSHADLIYSNLNNEFDVFFTDVNRWTAGSFVTDASTSGTFGISVGLKIWTYGAPTQNDFFVRLYSDSGTGPGGLITALTGDSDPDSAALFRAQIYDYTGTVTLVANTPYWVAFGTMSPSGPGDNDYWVGYDRTPAETGADLGQPYGSSNQGTNWTLGGYPGAHINDRVNMTVTTTAVPEPSSAVGVFLALSWALVWRQRQRKLT